MYKPRINKSISPTMLKQYIYCPVIPWIINYYNVQEPPTDSMKIAKEKQEAKQGKGQIHIKTKTSYTVIDEIVEDKAKKTLIERKQYRSKSIHRYLAQTIATYLIARQKIKNIEEIIIDNGGEQHQIPITQEIIQQIQPLLRNLEKTLNNEKPPPPTTNTKKCRTCWYKKYCPYQ